MNKSNEEKFVAINHIQVREDYRERMEYLFKTRAHAIENCKGFYDMRVLRPTIKGDPYLVVSEWESEKTFKEWELSEEFFTGHKRAFEDLDKAKELKEEPPMISNFKTFELVAN